MQRMQIGQFVSVFSFWQMPQASPIMGILKVEVLKSFNEEMPALQ